MSAANYNNEEGRFYFFGGFMVRLIRLLLHYLLLGTGVTSPYDNDGNKK